MKPDILALQSHAQHLHIETSFRKPPLTQTLSGTGAATIHGAIVSRESEILLVTHDDCFCQNIRQEAGEHRMVRVGEMAEAIRTLRAINPAAVLVDLDIPAGVGWETADRLLQDKECPPTLLLTGRTGIADVQMAIRAGSIVQKSIAPLRLWQIVDQIIHAPRSDLIDRTIMLRVVVLWLKPFDTSTFVPAYRDFGIND